jgi:phage-related protein
MTVRYHVQYNQIRDVTNGHRDIVEKASGEDINNLEIDDVNSFLNGLYMVMYDEDLVWKS